MYTYCKKYGNQVFLRTNDSSDAKRITKHQWNLFYENNHKDSPYKNIYGKSLKKSTFTSIRTAQENKKENERAMPVYGAKDFGYQYIRDKFFHLDPITPNDIYIANIDIETGRDEYGYSPASEARCPITSITLHDISKDQYYVWGYHSDGYTPKSDNVYYVNCKDEMQMLVNFSGFIAYRHPHILTGWNCENYDYPYIINRINNIVPNGANYVEGLSPFGIVNEKNQKDKFGKEVQTYDIVGISILDYLTLFKKYSFISPDNYKLDTVAQLVLKDKKIDYSEYKHLQDLYTRNYELFIDYNIQDVNIVTRLDKKLKLFNLVLKVAYMSGINYSDVLSPVNTWDVFIYNSIMDKNIIPSCSSINNESRKYKGGYVKEPIKGKLKKWILSFDLNSMYPHLQMGINISPEKKLFSANLPKELQDIQNTLKKATDCVSVVLNEEIDTTPLIKYNVSLSPNGEFYEHNGQGFIPEILEELYNNRSAEKRMMLQYENDYQETKDESLLEKISIKSTSEKALKNLLVSNYGVQGTEYFRYFDVDTAEAITLSGQLAIKWVEKHVNIFLNRILSTEDIDYVCYIDTDSIYVELEVLVDKFITDKNDAEIVDILDGWAKNVMEPEIERIYEKLAIYINSRQQKMVMKREVIADKGFWQAKKMYALNIYDKEGVRYSTPKSKIMGLKCTKSSYPEWVRVNTKKAIIKILNEDEISVQKYISSIKDDFFNQSPEDISFPKGTTDIDKWIDDNGAPKKGTPIHVRGCIVYNKYLDSINSVDERIQSGDKIKYTALNKHNDFGSHVIAFPPQMNEEVHELLKKNINYEEQWMKSLYKPVQSMLECIGWSPEKISKIEDICQGEEY
jgi:DNA polymerase elongation subunit (family B)